MNMLGNKQVPRIGRAGSFSPLDVSTKWWVDASSAANMYQDSARTVAVTTNNDPVGILTDLSATAKNASQATAGYRPLYKTGIQNGLSVLLFDGVDDKIATASVVSTATTTFEMFIVTKALATTPERVVFHNGNNTTGYGYTQSDYYTSKQGFLIGGVTWVQSVDDVDTTNFHIYLLRRLSGTMTLYRNGTSIATSTSVPLAATTRTILGDYTNGTKPTSCYIAEATLHEGLSTLAVNQMGNYYATKWGLSWSAI